MIASYEPRDRRLYHASLRLSLWMKPSYTRLWLQTHSLRNVPPQTRETERASWALRLNALFGGSFLGFCGVRSRDGRKVWKRNATFSLHAGIIGTTKGHFPRKRRTVWRNPTTIFFLSHFSSRDLPNSFTLIWGLVVQILGFVGGTGAKRTSLVGFSHDF